MTTLYEGAFAKINLTLDVLGKRPDGYHDLKSVMQTISIRDDIEGRADLAEEVMRIYGYDHIVGTAMKGEVVRGRKLPERIKADML